MILFIHIQPGLRSLRRVLYKKSFKDEHQVKGETGPCAPPKSRDRVSIKGMSLEERRHRDEQVQWACPVCRTTRCGG